MRLALAAALLVSCGPAEDEPLADVESDLAATSAFDVIVVGAGPGGISAALQAARMGRSVALLEQTDHVGGQLLSVPCMDLGAPFFTEGGLFAEFVAGLRARYGTRPLGTCGWSPDSIAYEPSVGEAVLRAMLAPNVRLFTRVSVRSVQRTSNLVTGLTTSDGRRWTSKVLVDATEYGDLMELAGVAYRLGRGRWNPATGERPSSNDCVQDITYPVAIRSYASFAAVPAGLDLRGGAPGADYMTQVAQQFSKVGPAGMSWEWHAAYRGTPDARGAPYTASLSESNDALITKTMVNAFNDYPFLGKDAGLDVDAVLDPDVRHAAECAARHRTLQFVYYAQTTLGLSWSLTDEVSDAGTATPCAGQSWAQAEKLFPQTPYVREGRRMLGLHTLTGREISRVGPATAIDTQYSAVTSFPDALALGAYPADLHKCNTDPTLELLLESSADVPPGFRGGPFQVPFGSFIPLTIDGFLAAEKNLSVSRLANGAIREQPISMATGQAVGALAALAAVRRVQPRAVPVVDVQQTVLAAGLPLSLYRFTDVPHGSPLWADVQLSSTHGLARTKADFTLGASDAVTRAELARLSVLAFGFPLAAPATPSFTDVPPSSPDYLYVEAAAREGLTHGCGTGLFCPDAQLTRGRALQLMARVLGHRT